MRSSLGSVFGSLPPMTGNREAVAVISALLVTFLLEANKELGVGATLWQLYALLRSTVHPDEYRRLVSALFKDLPLDIQVDIRREVLGLTDAGSVLLLELSAAQSPFVEGRSSPHPGPVEVPQQLRLA